MSNFGTKEVTTEDLKGNDFAPQLTVPYCGPAHFREEDFGAVTITNKDETDSWDVLKFPFVLTHPDFKGVEFEHTEFEPKAFDDQDLAEVQDKCMSRVAYILSFAAGEEIALRAVNAADSWEKLRENVQKVIDGSREMWEGKELKIKVLGSINPYNSKPRLGFPGYKGYISDEESDKVVSLSRKEIEGNQEFLKAQNSASSDTDEVENTPDDKFAF